MDNYGFAGESPLPIDIDPVYCLTELEKFMKGDSPDPVDKFMAAIIGVVSMLPCSSEYKYMGDDFTLWAKSGGTMITITLVDNENENNHRAGSFYMTSECHMEVNLAITIMNFIKETITTWTKS